MGFGSRTDETFDAKSQVLEIANFLNKLNKKVFLVGFSLGANVAFKLICDYQQFFRSAILVSPMLIEDKKLLKEASAGALRGLKIINCRFLCKILAFLSGIPKKIRSKFIDQLKKVKVETMLNAVNNGIYLDTVNNFKDVSIPISVAIGEKELNIIKDSAKICCNMNKNCNCVVFKNAAHNIPFKFSGNFNDLILKTFLKSN